MVTIVPQGITATDISGFFQSIKNENLEILGNIPKQYGKIHEMNLFDKEKPEFILIYDIHCQPYAQNNIYSIINYIDSCFDIDKIFIEGAPNGKIDISSIKDIDIEIRKNILNKMISKGYLSGTELYSYLSEEDNLYGIEDFTLYMQTVKEYAAVINFQKEYLSFINSSDKHLKKFKRKFYSADMRFFEKLFFENIQYDKKTIDSINEFLAKHNVDLKTKYPNLDKYLKIKEYELIDTKNYYKDLQTLISACKNKIPSNIYINLINNIKNKHIEEQLLQVYASIKQFLPKEQISKYSYVEKIENKNIILSEFNINGFLQEKKDLYSALSNKLFNNEQLSEARFETKILYTLKKYVQLKVTYSDIVEMYSELNKIKECLKNSKTINNKEQLLEILNNKHILSYYDNHILRNNIFTKNILEQTNDKTTNIVVVGGFHNEIENLLNKNDIKYISIFPNATKTDYSVYNQIMTDMALTNCLADTPLVAGLSHPKQKEFLVSWIQELQKQGFKDYEIIKIINTWVKKHKEFFTSDTTETDVTETVLKNNNFSLKGWLLKLRDLIKENISKFENIFNYKYVGDNPNNLSQKDIKNMVSNIKYFPFIQLVLGFDLYSSFAMVFMQSGGYGLPVISLVMSLIAPVSFAVSGIGGIVGDKFSKKKLIIGSIAIHTLGIIAFAFSGLSPVLLVASQILPTIGVSMLTLTLSPFLYKSLDNLGVKDSFKEIYGSNLSLFWIVMSVSTLLGGLLVSLTSQFNVILLAAIPGILVSTGALFFTHNENINNGNKTTIQEKITNKENKSVKSLIFNFIEPVIKLSTDKKTFSLAVINIVVNNIFFVVMCFFLQPALMASGINVAFFAPVYFLGNLMQSLASHFIKKVCFIAENKTIRTITFASSAMIFSLFVITGHPIFLIAFYGLMNFWQGTSSLAEVSSVYKTLDNDMVSKWLGFKSMIGMIIATITQISISGLLTMGISNNILIGVAVSIITGVSIIVPKITDSDKNKDTILGIEDELNITQLKNLLASA